MKDREPQGVIDVQRQVNLEYQGRLFDHAIVIASIAELYLFTTNVEPSVLRAALLLAPAVTLIGGLAILSNRGDRIDSLQGEIPYYSH